MADLNKIVDEISGLSLMDAAQLVKMLEDKLGVTAAAPMAMAAMPAAGPAPAAAPAEEKTEFNVILKAAGEKKIEVIKAVRQIVSSLGLKEAKELVDTAPQPVLQGVSKEAAQDARAKLEAAGASVSVE